MHKKAKQSNTFISVCKASSAFKAWYFMVNLNGLDFDSKSSIEMSIYSHKVQQLKANSSIGMEFDSSLERSSRNPEFEVYASKYSYRALVSQQDHSLTKLQQINQKYSKSNLKS